MLTHPAALNRSPSPSLLGYPRHFSSYRYCSGQKQVSFGVWKGYIQFSHVSPGLSTGKAFLYFCGLKSSSAARLNDLHVLKQNKTLQAVSYG